MQVMVIYRPRDSRRATARFARWTPLEGYQIKTHHFSPDGRGFALVEPDSAVSLVAASAAFNEVMEFEFAPLAPIEDAVAATLERFAWVDSVEIGQ